jgi:MFS family permease
MGRPRGSDATDLDRVIRKRGARHWPDWARSLEGPDFRLYFQGQAVSLLGSWTQQVALVWLVYRLTGSAALLGVTTFVGLVPQLLIGPLAGAWIDRQDKRRWLIIVELMMALQALLLALTSWAGWVGPGFIVAMSLILGVLRSFDGPLRHTLISAFVASPQDLPNALALNAMLVNAGRFIGPPLAGLLIGATSEAFCFLVNGLSFAALIAALLRARATTEAHESGTTAEVFRDGLRYLRHTPSARLLIFTLAAVNLTASSYATLLPILAKAEFQGDARTLGWLWGAAGAGAFAGTLVLARHRSLGGIAHWLLVAVCGSAATLVAIGGFAAPLAAAAALTLMGCALTVCNAGGNILLQAEAPTRLRGRVVAFFMATRFGFEAIGGLLAGLVAAWLPIRATFLIEGGLLAVCAAAIVLRRHDLDSLAQVQHAHPI